MVLKQVNYSSTITRKDFMPSKMSRNLSIMPPAKRAQKVKDMEKVLVQMTPTPLKPIKQVELWKKWGPLLPEEDRCITYPKTSDEIIQSIKDINNKKLKIYSDAKTN
eukprot:9918412-Ditylum_brightwellii.AAC.1